MKKFLSLLTAASVLSLGGCTFGTSIDNLMTPPKLSIEQEQIYSALTDAAGASVSLKYPKTGKYLSAFIVEDIDGDGGNEAVVFYEKNSLTGSENTLRINILDKSENGNWHSVYDTPADGSEIERVIISRLGENDRINLIIGSNFINRSEKNVSVYSYSDNGLERTFYDSYSFIDVTDLDNDDENEFLLLKGFSGDSAAKAEAYKLDAEGVYHRYHAELSNSFTDFDSVSYGDISDSKKGLYIDAFSGNGYIQTDIVYMDSSGLKNLFSSPDESLKTIRSSGCRSADIDSDGILEIPVQHIAPGYEDAPEGEQLRITEWLTVSETGKTENKYQSYYSVGDGYAFIFPEKWRSRVTIKRDSINDEIVVCTYSSKEMGRELLRIYCAEDEASLEDRTASGYMLMKTKGKSSYLVYIPEYAENDGLSITQAETAINFRSGRNV